MKKKIKYRRNWGTIKPVTKIKPSAKVYRRAKVKPTIWEGRGAV